MEGQKRGQGQTKKIKLEWDGKLIGDLIRKYNEDKETFTLTITNYTCLIESETEAYHFVRNMQRKQVFSVNAAIKRYLDTSLKFDVTDIDREEMRYYSAKAYEKPLYKPIAYNVDIKAAYPSCLLNEGLIDGRVFARLMGLSKEERLAAIGMLASRRRIFTLENGEVKLFEEKLSEYSKYFFYCVKTIANIIWDCEVIAGTSFLYSWVDGLYVTDRAAAIECRKVIKAKGYKCSLDKIEDFQYEPKGTYIRVSFMKGGENKVFNIPIENNRLAQIMKFIHNDTIHG